MTRRTLILIATAGSLALLLGALAFEHLGGLAPCKLCIWQRWPHVSAVLAGASALVMAGPVFPLVGAVATALTGGIGVFHVGVEKGWWQGPDTCTSGSIEGLSADELMNQILGAPLVQCDQVAWEMLGISMAGWNAILSFGLMAVWLMAVRRGFGR